FKREPIFLIVKVPAPAAGRRPGESQKPRPCQGYDKRLRRTNRGQREEATTESPGRADALDNGLPECIGVYNLETAVELDGIEGDGAAVVPFIAGCASRLAHVQVQQAEAIFSSLLL